MLKRKLITSNKESKQLKTSKSLSSSAPLFCSQPLDTRIDDFNLALDTPTKKIANSVLPKYSLVMGVLSKKSRHSANLNRFIKLCSDVFRLCGSPKRDISNNLQLLIDRFYPNKLLDEISRFRLLLDRNSSQNRHQLFYLRSLAVYRKVKRYELLQLPWTIQIFGIYLSSITLKSVQDIRNVPTSELLWIVIHRLSSGFNLINEIDDECKTCAGYLLEALNRGFLMPLTGTLLAMVARIRTCLVEAKSNIITLLGEFIELEGESLFPILNPSILERIKFNTEPLLINFKSNWKSIEFLENVLKDNNEYKQSLDDKKIEPKLEIEEKGSSFSQMQKKLLESEDLGEIV